MRVLPPHEIISRNTIAESCVVRIRGREVTVCTNHRTQPRHLFATLGKRNYLNPLATGRKWRTIIKRIDEVLRKEDEEVSKEAVNSETVDQEIERVFGPTKPRSLPGQDVEPPPHPSWCPCSDCHTIPRRTD